MISDDRYTFQITVMVPVVSVTVVFFILQCKCQHGIKSKWKLSITEHIFISICAFFLKGS